MDYTKRMPPIKPLRLFTFAITLCIAVAIICHSCKNHTKTVIKEGIALPADVITKPVKPIVAAPPIVSSVTKTVEFKSSVIHHSLLQAERATGLPVTLQHQLDHMLSSGLAGEIHPGDHLNVLYHEYFVGDHKDHPGNIVAAEITNGKKAYRIVRFTAPNHQTGYYTANGNGTKPMFLKTPLHYKRIGSPFSYDRMDPVIHKVHPHLGVDLDAPKGTPVKAIGNGIVVFCKQMRGYGNVVMIRYNDRYKSLYAHLEKFSAHMHANEAVKKGQVVGYVGATGWATGPHLHFSLYKNGVAINPMTAHFPNASPVPTRYRHAFLYEENRWFSEMKLFEAAQAPAKKQA